jgi:hypothetical protein
MKRLEPNLDRTAILLSFYEAVIYTGLEPLVLRHHLKYFAQPLKNIPLLVAEAAIQRDLRSKRSRSFGTYGRRQYDHTW